MLNSTITLLIQPTTVKMLLYSSSPRTTDHASFESTFTFRQVYRCADPVLISGNRVVRGYASNTNDFIFNNSLTSKLFDLIKEFSSGKAFVSLSFYILRLLTSSSLLHLSPAFSSSAPLGRIVSRRRKPL